MGRQFYNKSHQMTALFQQQIIAGKGFGHICAIQAGAGGPTDILKRQLAISNRAIKCPAVWGGRGFNPVQQDTPTPPSPLLPSFLPSFLPRCHPAASFSLRGASVHRLVTWWSAGWGGVGWGGGGGRT